MGALEGQSIAVAEAVEVFEGQHLTVAVGAGLGHRSFVGVLVASGAALAATDEALLSGRHGLDIREFVAIDAGELGVLAAELVLEPAVIVVGAGGKSRTGEGALVDEPQGGAFVLEVTSTALRSEGLVEGAVETAAELQLRVDRRMAVAASLGHADREPAVTRGAVALREILGPGVGEGQRSGRATFEIDHDQGDHEPQAEATEPVLGIAELQGVILPELRSA